MGVLTREYPPDVYGGAGVHVDFLVRELRRLVDVDVHCFGAPREDAVAHQVPPGMADANPALQTLGVDRLPAQKGFCRGRPDHGRRHCTERDLDVLAHIGLCR